MKIIFKSHKWDVILCEGKYMKDVPKIGAVYIITVKVRDEKKRKIIYIGVSRNLKYRMWCHDVLKLLRYNKTNFIIEILYASFGGRLDNGSMERRLISKYPTPFNGYNQKRNKYNINDMWDDFGVTNIRYKKRDKKEI